MFLNSVCILSEIFVSVYQGGWCLISLLLLLRVYLLGYQDTVNSIKSWALFLPFLFSGRVRGTQDLVFPKGLVKVTSESVWACSFFSCEIFKNYFFNLTSCYRSASFISSWINFGMSSISMKFLQKFLTQWSIVCKVWSGDFLNFTDSSHDGSL